ncbi:MAG: hypothetical protein JSU87_07395 [Gemmatimonadota bacterium]|nr:MAG: hypothetical protein JSU87_07395 [Gemmatimonadota bacterium]
MSDKRERIGRTGFGTLGMIIALALLGFTLVPVLGTVVTAQRGIMRSRERARAAASVRYAHLALTRLMRIAGSSPIGPHIQGLDPDPLRDGIFDDIRLRADYNPPDGDIEDPGEDLTFYLRADTMFVRAGIDGAEEPYLIGVDSLAFAYFEWDGTPITDPARVTERAVEVHVTVRASGEDRPDSPERLLTGHVRLRNGG